MKKTFNKSSVVATLVFALALIGPMAALAAGPLPVNLLSISTNNFAILSKTGITNTGSHISIITGNIGSSPITAAAMDNVFCSEITGTIYGVDAAYTGSGTQACFAGNPPMSNKTLVDNAVLDMGTAYGDAAGRTGPTATELGAGNIGGMTLAPGLYKWSTDVTIPTSVTLSGGANDVWIFQISGNLNIASGGSVPAGIKVILSGGAQASNVFWQVGGPTGATLGTYSTFNGTILSAKQVIIQTGAVLNGRALAQTQVTLDANTVSVPTVAVLPATLHIEKLVVNGSVGTALPSTFTVHVKNAGVDVSGSPAAGASLPGTLYSLAAGTYVVSEDANASYTQVFSGDCNSSGSITLAPGDDKLCTLINTNIALPPAPASPSSGGNNASNFNAPLPLINITKIPAPLALPSGPGSVTYTYTVTNVGQVPMIGVWVKDNQCSAVNFISGDTNNNTVLDLDETWVYRCTTLVSKTTTNTATAHGQANGWDGYDIANATVVVGTNVTPPLIHVIKKPNVFVLPSGGGAVTYSYLVTNPGTVPLSDVSITDDKCTGLPGRVVGHPGDLNKNNLLENNETWQFTCETRLTQTTTNIGTAVGHANGLTAVDLSPATVVVATPGLPNTGIGPDDNSGVWNTIIVAGILVAISAFYLGRKKLTA